VAGEPARVATKRSIGSTNAERLVGWIRFLGSRGRTVHTAGEDDYRAYEAAYRFPGADDHPELTPVSSAWWRTTKSIIKQFHEWLADPYPGSCQVVAAQRSRA